MSCCGRNDVPRVPGTLDGSCGTFPLRGLPRTSYRGTCIPNPVAVGNDALSGQVDCEVGDPVPWTVEVDKFFAPTKAEANALAQASAEYLAAGQCSV